MRGVNGWRNGCRLLAEIRLETVVIPCEQDHEPGMHEKLFSVERLLAQGTGQCECLEAADSVTNPSAKG